MLIDVRPILSGAVTILPFDYTIDPPAPFSGIDFPSPVRIRGQIRNQAGYMTLSAQADVPYKTNCARCTKPIAGVFHHSFTRTLATRLEKQQDDDYLMIVKDRIEIDEPLVEDLLLSLDFAYLCKEDCKGLCPSCGKDLNEGPCHCAEKKEVDPRLAILAKLLDK